MKVLCLCGQQLVLENIQRSANLCYKVKNVFYNTILENKKNMSIVILIQSIWNSKYSDSEAHLHDWQ